MESNIGKWNNKIWKCNKVKVRQGCWKTIFSICGTVLDCSKEKIILYTDLKLPYAVEAGESCGFVFYLVTSSKQAAVI